MLKANFYNDKVEEINSLISLMNTYQSEDQCLNVKKHILALN